MSICSVTLPISWPFVYANFYTYGVKEIKTMIAFNH